MSLYRIKPLAWDDQSSDGREYFESGSYGVWRLRGAAGDAPVAGWRWAFAAGMRVESFCKPCNSFEDGQRAANEHHRETLNKWLEEVVEPALPPNNRKDRMSFRVKPLDWIHELEEVNGNAVAQRERYTAAVANYELVRSRPTQDGIAVGNWSTWMLKTTSAAFQEVPDEDTGKQRGDEQWAAYVATLIEARP